ncbi:MAG TPA: carbohydrate porin [Polyangia bacterium]|jgi:high affinity Mn2+ porin|nr:carbohydrate porin [Polyangia bacterium]
MACAVAIGLTSSTTAQGHSPRDEPSEDKPSPPVDPSRGEQELYSFHFQSTAATQYHPSFSAAYSGQNSLSPQAESATAFVSTIYADFRLWRGAELLFNPEMSGGKGLSKTLGVAAFPSGIVYRVGDPAPAVYLARLAVSQSFDLGGGRVTNEAGPNELAGTRDRNILAISVGRLSVADVFDGNRYAHDPTERFFNWAMFASGAWDYPADTRGYTYGVLADLAIGWWSARAGIAVEPKVANGLQMDWHLTQAHALMAEYEARYTFHELWGATSGLVFLNQAHMGLYQQVLNDPAAYGNDVANTRAYRNKYGFAISVEQQLTRRGLGSFLRLSANDGATETWAFTEIDRSLAVGVVQDGELWRRNRDEAGVAVVINGLSGPHRQYLAGGGYGFIIGDGALRYAPEVLGEFYYTVAAANYLWASVIYQPIANPAYNSARGPVQVFSARVKAAF